MNEEEYKSVPFVPSFTVNVKYRQIGELEPTPMNDWFETKEHPPTLPDRDVTHQPGCFFCGSCGRQVWDTSNSESPNFLCTCCRKKWNVKPE